MAIQVSSFILTTISSLILFGNGLYQKLVLEKKIWRFSSLLRQPDVFGVAFNFNLLVFFSTERGKRDLENWIID